MSEETKKKISDKNKGKVAWNVSKPRTDEEKVKMRESAIKRHQKKREDKEKQNELC